MLSIMRTTYRDIFSSIQAKINLQNKQFHYVNMGGNKEWKNNMFKVSSVEKLPSKWFLSH